MNTREKILETVRKNQPPPTSLPDLSIFKGIGSDLVREYSDTFISIGGNALVVDDIHAVVPLIRERFDISKRVITTLPELSNSFELYSATADPHTFEDVEVAIINGELAVAENGAVWFPEQLIGQRIIPFICQHLVALVRAGTIVSTLHEAYAKIGQGHYGFGAFIGGPSKTADIEQALVMGAHGPISMTVFIIK
jgi:L-lactate dehydrogenase complex protein LldG